MGLTGWVAGIATDYQNPRSLGFRLRVRRMQLVVEMMRSVHQARGRVRLLDIGGTRTYWRTVSEATLAELRAEIVLLNLPGEGGAVREGHFESAEGDGRDLRQFDDLSFDMIHSNSVIEHVGGWSDMRRFATEVSRLAPSYYVQTPNFWFPIEPHFMAPCFHWLPRPLRIWLLQRWRLGHYQRQDSVDHAALTDEGVRLLDAHMLRALFPDCQLVRERFALLTKSLIAVRPYSQRPFKSAPSQL